MKLYWKGDILDERQARILVSEEAFLQGSAMVETMRVESGRILHVDMHLERFTDAAKALLAPPMDAAAFREIARHMVRINRLRQGSLRCRYFRDGSLLVHPLPRPRTPPAWKAGIRLITTVVRHYGPESLQGRLKANSMLTNLLSRWESLAWAEDGLRLTPQGFVAEGIWSNILIEKRGTLLSPPLPMGVLAGTTRQAAIQSWRRKGRLAKEMPLTRYDLYTADRAWACSSLRGLVKIREVDGRPIGRQGVIR
jgi:branched-subunit amino acid aminotransferase/4-amino-4-deoxychorismate lyase